MIRFDKSSKEFVSLSWMVHNVENLKGDGRTIGGVIKVEQAGDLTICIYTDSHRMAILRYHENCPLEEGFYKIIKQTKMELFLEKYKGAIL